MLLEEAGPGETRVARRVPVDVPAAFRLPDHAAAPAGVAPGHPLARAGARTCCSWRWNTRPSAAP